MPGYHEFGGDAQIKAMKKVAGTLKPIMFCQYREPQSFAQLDLIWMRIRRHVWNRDCTYREVLETEPECTGSGRKAGSNLGMQLPKGILEKVKVEDVAMV
ncbi:MAG: hypothetical protein ACLUS5_18260 [Roseburia faecis]